MSLPRLTTCLYVALLSGSFSLSPLVAQTPAPIISTFARLGGTPSGSGPQPALVQGSDGSFYGTTRSGGPTNCGTIYRVAPDGILTTIYAFRDAGDGANPTEGLVFGPDGNLYGTTSNVTGGHDQGTVFRLTLTGTLTTLHTFSPTSKKGVNLDGADPESALVLGSDGNFYGTTLSGGTAGKGTIFKIKPNGALTTLHSFSHANSLDFFGPKAALVEGPDGNFYGAAHQVDTNFPYDSKYGVIYRMTPSGDVSLFYSFSGGAGGANSGPLLLGTDGNFYGLTTGATRYARPLMYFKSADSTFFRLSLDGVLTTLYDFNPDALGNEDSIAAPRLIQGLDGNFYGSAAYTGTTAMSARSTVFRLTPTGALTALYSFAQTPNDFADPSQGTYLEGGRPEGVTLGQDGNFYGVTTFGGGPPDPSGVITGAGTFFRLTPAGAVTTFFRFAAGGDIATGTLLQEADGNFYGVTAAGGLLHQGTLFRANLAGEITTLHDFKEASDGSLPNGGLVRGKDGTFYGTTGNRLDGAYGGTIYSASKDGTVKSLYSFRVTSDEGPGGSLPNAGLVTNADGTLLYGTTARGGANDGGTVFSFDPATGVETALHSFAYSDPLASYTIASDGISPGGGVIFGAGGTLLYGITSRGGAYGQGTVFSLDLTTGEEKVLHSFGLRGNDGIPDGANPHGSLILGADGNLYGQTSGQNSLVVSSDKKGAVFRITPAGTLTTLHTFTFSGSVGSGLLQDGDGSFYGADGNTAYVVKSDGTLTDFNGAIQAADGNLYGVSFNSIPNGGTIYRATLNTATIPPPTVAICAINSQTAPDSVQKGGFLLTLSRPATTDIQVTYAVKGNAVSGEDYVALKGTAKIKAGQTSKTIKIKPLGNSNGTHKSVVKLTLTPEESYTLSTAKAAKVKIIAVTSR